MTRENDADEPSIANVRLKILHLKHEEDWNIDTLMVAMSGLLADMIEQGQTPEEWARAKERWSDPELDEEP